MEYDFVLKDIHMNIYKYFLILITFVPYGGILFHYKTPFTLVKGNQMEYIAYSAKEGLRCQQNQKCNLWIEPLTFWNYWEMNRMDTPWCKSQKNLIFPKVPYIV